LIFLWRDETFMPGLDPTEVGESWVVVNGECLDISKERVQDVHQLVFDYSLAVDPMKFQGRMLRKSNLNGAHNGTEVIGPLKELKQGAIYQRIVDNTPVEIPREIEKLPGVVCDIRVPIFGQHADFVYLKYRAKATRYSNSNAFVRIVEIHSVFSAQECNIINAFCREFKLDYGEIDIVRDANDGKYIFSMSIKHRLVLLTAYRKGSISMLLCDMRMRFASGLSDWTLVVKKIRYQSY
jgi:hypothetical protein